MGSPMPRIPQLIESDDGSVSIRTVIPRPIWLVVRRIADRFGVKPEIAMNMFWARMEGMFCAGADIAFLGFEWQEALRQATTDNFGVIATGPPIDISKLHKSKKTKSGYVGVYANGKGFRASGKIPGQPKGERYIGTFQTAEEAAWRRYLYYQNNKIPYGEMEIEIDLWRSQGSVGTDAELEKQILEHAVRVGTLHHFVEPSDPRQASAAYDPYDMEVPLPPEMEAKIRDFEEKIKARQAKAAELEAVAKADGRMIVRPDVVFRPTPEPDQDDV